ncbi:hypothetical protein [Desulfobacula sp.]|uniref:hypothetical protein n=1 Tax=Desulfobacula sp. TaxID=2593537 RepID=UPI00263848FF|nr:hypothetical protein [Desulfobacula sp.]
MFWHPLLLAIISAQIVALLLLLAGSLTSLNTALHWQPLSADSRQLSLEARAEGVSIQGRAAFWLSVFSAVLLVFGITNIFAEDIPGAMCGTGVCQAMSPRGSTQLLLYTGLLLLLMQLWHEMDKLNRMLVEMPLTDITARLFLVIPAVAVLTLKQTYASFAGIRPHQPVDCCAVVYDQFTTLKHAKSILGLGDAFWISAFIVLSLALFSLSVALRTSMVDRPGIRGLHAIISCLWLPVASLTLVNIFSAYHYEVLHHHCPWCLFLPEHRLVGYPLYGALYVIGMEGFTLFMLPRLANQDITVYKKALDRCRRAANRITFAQLLFLIIAILPAIVWRLHYGVWMSG